MNEAKPTTASRSESRLWDLAVQAPRQGRVVLEAVDLEQMSLWRLYDIAYRYEILGRRYYHRALICARGLDPERARVLEACAVDYLQQCQCAWNEITHRTMRRSLTLVAISIVLVVVSGLALILGSRM